MSSNIDARLFVSYSSEDKEFVEQNLIPVLHEFGVIPWYADRQIKPAKEWEAEIRGELKACDWFLVVISKAAVQSDWVRTEVHWAIELRPKRIIQILVDDSDPGDCHMKLKLIQHIHWDEGPQKVHAKLLSVLTKVDAQEETDDANRAGGDDIALVTRLRALRAAPDKDEVPFLFGCLTHDEEGIRQRAMQVIQKIGWGEVTNSIQAVARTGPQQAIEAILNGLSAIEATDKTVAVLAKLCELLSGDLRNRVLVLTEKKRLSLQLDDIAKLFIEFHQPHELQQVLGLGLFTASYRARHKLSGHQVVVRVLRPELALRDDIRTQFVELTNRSTEYVHEALALTRDVNQFPKYNVYFCIRDYIEGPSLQKVLDAGQKFEAVQVIEILRQVASALTPVHARGEFHGGVKPSNVFVVGERKILLGDPSLPVSLVPPNLPRLAYDYRYAAPENFQVNQSLGPQADYYALGCVAYELLCGEPPFASDNPFYLANLHREACVKAPSQRSPVLDGRSDELLLRLLAKEAHHRPRGVNEVFQILDELRACVFSPTGSKEESGTILKPSVSRDIPADSTRIIMTSPAELDVDHTIYISGAPSAILPVSTAGVQPAISENADEAGVNTVNPSVKTGQLESGQFEPGHVIKERFIIENIIGQGGMGAVYKARDLRRQEYRDRNPYVAVKVLNVDLKAHADAAVALQREAKKSQKLAHPNILTVYDFDRDGDIVYMTMELLEGEPLQETIKRAGEQGLAVNEALPLVDGMGQALAFAHKQGIVHSDFKPGNVFVGKDSAVKVLDFGIARAINTDNVKDVTQLGFSVALTPAYASCEMLEGLEPDPRDDIFALACITYELLSGRHPFKRIPAVQAHAAGLKPARIKGLDNSQWKGLMHGLAFSRDHRTPSVEQFLSELHSQKLSWAARIFKR